MLNGTIIEESLDDHSVLNDLEMTNTTVEKVTKKHQTPWLKQWTLDDFEVAEDDADAVADRFSKALELEHSWYVDFKDKDSHYFIFRDKVFHIHRTHDGYQKVKEYGASIGIPDYQLDFTPEIN